MTRDHISRIPLDEQISMAGAGEDPQAVFCRRFCKKRGLKQSGSRNI